MSDELAVIRPDFSIILDPEKSDSFWVFIKNGVFSWVEPDEVISGVLDPQLVRNKREKIIILYLCIQKK